MHPAFQNLPGPRCLEFWQLLQEKRPPATHLAELGCCRDFASPCEVPAFPPGGKFNDTYTKKSDYGPYGLYWPYGGSGTFISAGLAVDVVGAEGWAHCARKFKLSDTDVQVSIGRCLLIPFRAARVSRTTLSPCDNHVIRTNVWTKPLPRKKPIPPLKTQSFVPENRGL